MERFCISMESRNAALVVGFVGEEGGNGGVEDLKKMGAALEARHEGVAEDVAFLLGHAGCFGIL